MILQKLSAKDKTVLWEPTWYMQIDGQASLS